jgi:hypothetical protein
LEQRVVEDLGSGSIVERDLACGDAELAGNASQPGRECADTGVAGRQLVGNAHFAECVRERADPEHVGNAGADSIFESSDREHVGNAECATARCAEPPRRVVAGARRRASTCAASRSAHRRGPPRPQLAAGRDAATDLRRPGEVALCSATFAVGRARQDAIRLALADDDTLGVRDDDHE